MRVDRARASRPPARGASDAVGSIRTGGRAAARRAHGPRRRGARWTQRPAPEPAGRRATGGRARPGAGAAPATAATQAPVGRADRAVDRPRSRRSRSADRRLVRRPGRRSAVGAGACRAPRREHPEWSVARRWDEALLDAIRRVAAEPARPRSQPVPHVGRDVGRLGHLRRHRRRAHLPGEAHGAGNVAAARNEAISYAAYRRPVARGSSRRSAARVAVGVR